MRSSVQNEPWSNEMSFPPVLSSYMYVYMCPLLTIHYGALWPLNNSIQADGNICMFGRKEGIDLFWRLLVTVKKDIEDSWKPDLTSL